MESTRTSDAHTDRQSDTHSQATVDTRQASELGKSLDSGERSKHKQSVCRSVESSAITYVHREVEWRGVQSKNTVEPDSRASALFHRDNACICACRRTDERWNGTERNRPHVGLRDNERAVWRGEREREREREREERSVGGIFFPSPPFLAPSSFFLLSAPRLRLAAVAPSLSSGSDLHELTPSPASHRPVPACSSA